METTKKEKQFDAVKMMRDIRDKISSETQNMTFDELKAYIKQQLADSKTKLVGQQQRQKKARPHNNIFATSVQTMTDYNETMTDGVRTIDADI